MAERPDTKTTLIGWIGTGVMGASMAGHLQKAGYRLKLFNRTKEKAESLLNNGALWADTPADAAEGCDFVFTIVGFPEDVREVYLGDTGIVSTIKKGAVATDMTTSEPSLAKEIAAAVNEKGAAALDAPVSGGDVGARNAQLCIMAGGPEDAYNKTLPLFELMGKTIRRFGEAGAGQHTKMVNQVLIAGGMIGLCEGLVYGHKAGLPMDEVIATLASGAANSWSLNNLAPRVLRGDFEPGFFVEHFIKDMGIALAEAQAMNLSMPGLALVHQMYMALKAQGGGKKGTQALILAIESLSGISDFAERETKA